MAAIVTGNAPSSPTSLGDMPDLILAKIFNFCNVEQHLACYRTCRKFNMILKNDDSLWEHTATLYDDGDDSDKGINRQAAVEADPRLNTHRLLESVKNALRLVRREQKLTASIVYDGLGGYDQVMALLWSLPLDCEGFPQNSYSDHNLHYLERVYLRGDTIAVLIELVEANMINILEQSYRSYLSFREKDDPAYPEFKATHFEFTRTQLGIEPFAVSRILGVLDGVEAVVRDRIVLRLCRRVGIVKIANEVCLYVWIFLLDTICKVFDLTKQYLLSRKELQPILPWQSIWSIPSADLVDKNGTRRRFVLIPKHVEDAFKINNYPLYKLYSCRVEWCLAGGDAVAAAGDHRAAKNFAVEMEGGKALLLYNQLDGDDMNGGGEEEPEDSAIDDIGVDQDDVDYGLPLWDPRMERKAHDMPDDVDVMSVGAGDNDVDMED